ncbi:MAG: bifunctional phosphopantothenoylcysteine decarboxylase/phosphopantothenate--cysteine ligase CoaBC [Actinobacteria bacterium]|nr:bifunctional phosphopantothenoylcysteine decarboxylase/phosphopantothenate--cysteine ligase CoaBC [Actinomycetota bacterium]NCX75701.1 bifunctional phosphopantothenoylcysteine decarboxylase/phosphopantothenate--cysteine ligase CoaBC [Actinomycetota bacterium]NDG09373.1 bifunctional phosphopantothenoylcysteine decarboxylase/phosphopantothenate--cysteine ligase CoaBC [Actinomycetota bacterium]
MITFPRGRQVVLGVGAGIAAYKACDLLRRLQDDGFEVTVIPTNSSLNFVGRATWEALSGKEVKTEVWEGTQSVSHVALADAADLIVIAPATADLISRLASGRADDLLTTTVLAASSPVLIVPSMHPGMYLNPATQANLETLIARGFYILQPDTGRLTGTDSGIGRFPETLRIIGKVREICDSNSGLKGKKIVVTTGGTMEPIDPVRFIGNKSSGRQGLAIAYEALREGAEVTVISGITEEYVLGGIKRIDVKTAQEMQNALSIELENADALVMAAAVADARPEIASSEKVNKEDFRALSLVKNPDILAESTKNKRENQVFVGFAAETGDGIREKGLKKLHSKGVDFLYVTDVSDGKVFGEKETTGILLSKRGSEWSFKAADKHELGRRIVSELIQELGVING